MNGREAWRLKGTMAATLLAIVAFLAPVQSGAAVSAGCGGDHGGAASCNFMPTGVNLHVEGEGEIFIDVRINDPLGRTLLRCSGYVLRCSAYFTPAGLGGGVESPIPTGPLLCKVESQGGGHYLCRSYPA